MIYAVKIIWAIEKSYDNFKALCQSIPKTRYNRTVKYCIQQ